MKALAFVFILLSSAAAYAVDTTIYIDQVGSNNEITIRQGNDAIEPNTLDLQIAGDSNTLNLNQSNTPNGDITNSTNGHYQLLAIYGDSNTFVTQQTNAGGTGEHYMETSIFGNTNNVLQKQTGNGNKIMLTSIEGNYNTVDAQQNGSGTHSLNLALSGNGNTTNILQEGTVGHTAVIDLTNAGGPNTLNLTQSSNTTALSYSISQSCANAFGCSVSVTQQ